LTQETGCATDAAQRGLRLWKFDENARLATVRLLLVPLKTDREELDGNRGEP